MSQESSRNLPGHNCVTVPEAGLAGKKNGELLSLAVRAGFEIFITLDRGIEFEQNLTRGGIAVVLIRAKSSRPVDVIPRASEVLAVLNSIEPGKLVQVS